jgi:elongation factor P--beta-lysine ligase
MNDWKPTASIATLEVRAAMLRAARDYFAATRTLEVETPTLSSGAVTDVHIASVPANPCGQQRFLHISRIRDETLACRGNVTIFGDLSCVSGQ